MKLHETSIPKWKRRKDKLFDQGFDHAFNALGKNGEFINTDIKTSNFVKQSSKNCVSQ